MLARSLATLNRGDGCTRVPLRGLSREEVTAYAQATAVDRPSSILLDRLTEQTEGNPFFLGEVLTLLRKDGKRILPSGEPITIEFLIDEPSFEPHHMPFIKNLGLLGIDATLRIVDPVQYRARRDGFELFVFETLGCPPLLGVRRADVRGSGIGCNTLDSLRGRFEAIVELKPEVIVLAPLAEITPDLKHPSWSGTASQLLAALDDKSTVKKLSGDLRAPSQ